MTRVRVGCFAVLASTVLILGANIGSANAMELGAESPGPSQVDAARAKVDQPAYRVHGEFNLAYWIGVTFPDGIFFQAGYLDASDLYTDLCQTGFSTFVTALNSGGESYFPSLYNNQNCGLTGKSLLCINGVEFHSDEHNLAVVSERLAHRPALNASIISILLDSEQNGHYH